MLSKLSMVQGGDLHGLFISACGPSLLQLIRPEVLLDLHTSHQAPTVSSVPSARKDLERSRNPCLEFKMLFIVVKCFGGL